MRRRALALWLIGWWLVWPAAPTFGQGAGYFIRKDCTTLLNPVAFQTVCMDATANQLRYWNGTTWVNLSTTAPIGHGQGRLTFSSATAIQFCPYNGQSIQINGTARTIPSACVIAANTNITLNGVGASNLAASTTYFVYLWMNGTTMTVDYSTTGHKTSSTSGNVGIEVLNGTDGSVCTTSDLCTLAGMVRTNASSQFEDDNALRGVISWFNRRDIGMINGFTANRTTTSATPVELNTEIRGNFISWTDEAILVGVGGSSSSSSGNQVITCVAVDSATVCNDAYSQQLITVATQPTALGITLVLNGSAEGFHFATLLGQTAGGTASWNGAPSGSFRTTLHVRIRG